MTFWVVLCFVCGFVCVALLLFIFLFRLKSPKTCSPNYLQLAAWDALKRNHPDLECLFRVHSQDKAFFDDVDTFMKVKTFNEFQDQSACFMKMYPEFAAHMRSLKMNPQEIWSRFQNHRLLAREVFSALRPK
jgi:hypothetical protein